MTQDTNPIKVGIVGTNTSHAGVFAGLINGREGRPASVPDAQVVAAWSSGRDGLSGRHQDAPELAADFGIAQVVADPADMVGEIDLVLVLDDEDGGARHPELARGFLEAGIATYVDKPMALTVDVAVDLFDLAARHRAPLMSCSALRFASALDAVRPAAVGELSLLVSVGPGDWYNYGIHAVEAAQAVIGAGASWVERSASAGRDVTVIGGENGPRTMIGTLRDAATGFHLTAFGNRGRAEVEVGDYEDFYTNTMIAAVEMARTSVAPINRRDTLEVLAVLAAGERSAETGDRVELSDILGAGAVR